MRDNSIIYMNFPVDFQCPAQVKRISTVQDELANKSYLRKQHLRSIRETNAV